MAEGPDDGLPEGWSFSVEASGQYVEYHCPPCVRANIRSIEGRLGTDWWEY